MHPMILEHIFIHLTDVGIKIGFKGWHGAHKLLNIIEECTGISIKNSDNIYHKEIRVGKSTFHKYSDSFIDLLERVKESNNCEIEWVNI